MAVTKDEWVEQCRRFRDLIGADDDDLRAFTLAPTADNMR